MLVLTSDVGLEPGLPVDQIESRLIDAARRHHLEERNIAYWLLELDRRRLYRARGFSSTGDYAMELVGIKPRKAQYLVFIATRLEKLPAIREAFDSGELTWTKAREIVSVATPETEAEWLAKAKVLSNRDLEKEVRRHDGRGSGAFATVTISMPVEVPEMWNDTYELAERLSGTPLEKWQVLEPSLAEFLGTHLPSAYGNGASPSEAPENDDEKGLPESVRNAVLDRDQWQCSFPGCTMRKTLEVHHIVFRSRGGSDEPGNLICLCRRHHALVHRGICSISGTVGVDLRFERPRLVNETEPKPSEPVVLDDPPDPAKEEVASEPDEIVGGFFDSPPSSKPPKFRDSFSMWVAEQEAFEAARLRKLQSEHSHSPDPDAGAHVCAELVSTDSNDEDLEVPDSRASGGPPGG